MDATRIAESRRELAHRSNNGVHVSLLWSSVDDGLVVTVEDDAGESFELVVGADEALEVFDHPYAYAAFRGHLWAAELTV
ncbi:MAG TPA: hypothetical protein VLB86_01195 [Gaiellaceae bacterium]|nr:hypothetical protein [Gaiellaceae bacterium]